MIFLPAMTNYVILDMVYNSTYIMGSLIGSYFNIYDWNNGSMISLILFAGNLYCFVFITGKVKTRVGLPETGGLSYDEESDFLYMA